MADRYSGASGNGPLVWKRTVCRSTTSTRSIAFTYSAMSVTVVGTFGTRSMVKATSSTVRGVPSEKVTPARIPNSQVVSSISRHERARLGFRWSCGSIEVRASNRLGTSPLLPPKLW